MSKYRALSSEEVEIMEKAGSSAIDWSQVRVKEGFDPQRVRRTHFAGAVEIGALQGCVRLEGGLELPAEIADATLANCTLGDNVRIARIGSHLSNYTIGSQAVVTDVGTMTTRPGATFGNGVEVEAVNEGGGREVPIFAEMSSQFAYLFAMHRYHPEMIAGLQAMVDAYVDGIRADRGCVGEGAVIAHVPEIVDVNIGPRAQVSSASRLCNGTILSETAAPARVGAGVMARDFIIGEGSAVEDGVVLAQTFVGQGVQLGKQFSAENSLFFANCEGFHGEACAVFAGPYTVTHHKSTLLIAGMYSFYNAGSGTNQSNHMYKLGPVHQGLLERGTKNGSFSYMLWPSVVGPFSVIIGKHLNNFDIGDLPFSYMTEEGGQSVLTPAMNMFTVGTLRDAEKWPARDRRRSSVKRDLIRFEMYSPYVVEKMIQAEAALRKLYEETPREVEQVRYKGVVIKRLLLRRSARDYTNGIDTYLKGKILDRVAPVRSQGIEAVRVILAQEGGYSPKWADIGGLLIAQQRLQELEDAIAGGKIATVADFHAAFSAAADAYDQDEWAWVRQTFASRTDQSIDDLTLEDLDKLEADYRKARATFIKKVLADAEKEFGEVAMFGYGVDGDEQARADDFNAVRGSFADNSFVQGLQDQLNQLSA